MLRLEFISLERRRGVKDNNLHEIKASGIESGCTRLT